MEISLQDIAKFLIKAEETKEEITRITAEIYPQLTIEEAYHIQEALIDIKKEKGHRILGPKMGLTSKAKMKQMNVDSPIYGYIFDYMAIPDGGDLSIKDLIHPKVEAELAFVIGDNLSGPDLTGSQVLAATDYVLPALEIIDSRYENFNFTLPDVIADNASSSRVVYGNGIIRPERLNCELDLIGTTLEVNGKMKAMGVAAAVLGHPANSIAELANMLAEKGDYIKKGQIILSGAMTQAVHFEEGDGVTAHFDQLGEVSFKVNL